MAPSFCNKSMAAKAIGVPGPKIAFAPGPLSVDVRGSYLVNLQRSGLRLSGGQAGGMVNEAGHFPEVCKKSLQAMASDMQGAIREDFYATYSIPQMQAFSPRELEHCGRLTTPLVVEAPRRAIRRPRRSEVPDGPMTARPRPEIVPSLP